jgi:O-antigen/teichoic acid export membrane protein
VYYPFIARFTANGELKRATEVINHSLRWISFFTILGALIVLLFGNEIVVLLFTEQYLPSVPAFILLMIALNLTLVDYTLGYSLVAAGDATRPMMINVAHTTINVLANLLLLPVFGIAGAALASITGFVATNPVYAWFLRRRELRVRVDYYLRPLAISGDVARATLALDPDSVIEKAAIIGFFLLACVVFSVIVREDVMIVFREARAIIARYLGVWRSRRAEV